MPIHNDFHASLPADSAERLSDHGYLLSVEVSPPQSLARLLGAQNPVAGQVAVGLALVDTGASCCCVEESVLRRLQLEPVRQTEVRSPNGARLQSVYVTRLSFPGSVVPAAELPVVGVQMGDKETIALIGRDFLRQCLLVYNGLAGNCSLAF
jgi:hypothetical protein